MTKDEYLLVVLSEECAEIQQAVSKALRFGLDSHDTPECTNENDILYEFYQLEAVMQMLFDRGVLHKISLDDQNYIEQNKKGKVDHYLSLACDLGIIK